MMEHDIHGDGKAWVTLGDAAQRLGVSRAAIYGRIKRDTVVYRRRNRGGYEVQWPLFHDGNAITEPKSYVTHHDDEAVTLKVEVAVLRERVERVQEGSTKIEAELRRQIEERNRRLEALEHELASKREKGFWAHLFGR